MWKRRGWRSVASAGPMTLLLCLSLVIAWDEDGSGLPLAPEGVTVTVTATDEVVTVTWTASSRATSYRAELNPGALAKTVQAGTTEAIFTPANGLQDGTEYTVTVYAINADGETASNNTPTVETDFFPWDEYYETSLHFTRSGKPWFYNEVPNAGFGSLTDVAYDGLACKNCHRPDQPSGEKGCISCHGTATPQLGADVDATLTGVCGACHGRQKAEAMVHGFTDVHRDAGKDCMFCHTLEDVHGDGNEYNSMLDDGAIDAACDDCHQSPAQNAYHTLHASTVDCSACHSQNVVTCNNCHFETEIQLDQRKAYGQFKNWKFLVNWKGKVHTANYQSVEYQGNTVVAFAPHYAHTIARNAVTCDDCHNSEAVQDWDDDGVMNVVWWNEGTQKLEYRQGIIPIPPDYDQGGMVFDFVTLDEPGGSVWSFVERGPDMAQMVFGAPLSESQMDKLK